MFPWKETGNCLYVSYASYCGDFGIMEDKKEASSPLRSRRPRTNSTSSAVASTVDESILSEDGDNEVEEMLMNETVVVHCESCNVSIKPADIPSASSKPLSLCARCLSSFLPTPFFAVELRMTLACAAPNSAADTDAAGGTMPGEIAVKSNTARFKYKYRPPTNSETRDVPSPSVATQDSPRTLNVEQHCWAVPSSEVAVLSTGAEDSRPALSLSLLHANYYETPFQKRKRSVRFDIKEERDDEGVKDCEDDEESAGMQCK